MKDVWIGFLTYAGYDYLVVADSEKQAWKLMKSEYYKIRKGWDGDMTWKRAIEWFGYRVEKMSINTINEY